uniref:Uncharacterized protein n=1 Tax=Oryzias melastigma TaxID=30732 RepID=A0A3B3CI39_ORYME
NKKYSSKRNMLSFFFSCIAFSQSNICNRSRWDFGFLKPAGTSCLEHEGGGMAHCRSHIQSISVRLF